MLQLLEREFHSADYHTMLDVVTGLKTAIALLEKVIFSFLGKNKIHKCKKKKKEEKKKAIRDGILKKQSNKVEMTPQYFYTSCAKQCYVVLLMWCCFILLMDTMCKVPK